MTPPLLYILSGAALFGLGLYGVLAHPHILRRILALNVAGSGVFLLLVALGRRPEPNGGAPAPAPTDPVPDALVLTGIVITVAATALALALGRRMARPDRDEGDE